MNDMGVDVKKLEKLCETAEGILTNQMSKLAVDNRYGYDLIHSIYSSIPSIKEALLRTILALSACARDYGFKDEQTPESNNITWELFEHNWIFRQQRNSNMSAITISSSSSDSDSDFRRQVEVDERTHFTRSLLSAPSQGRRNLQRRPLNMDELRDLLISEGSFTSSYVWKYGLSKLNPESTWPKGIKPGSKLCFIWMPLILSALDRITNKEDSNIFYKLPESPILEVITKKFITFLRQPDVQFFEANVDGRAHLTCLSQDQLITRLTSNDMQHVMDYVEDQIGQVCCAPCPRTCLPLPLQLPLPPLILTLPHIALRAVFSCAIAWAVCGGASGA